MRSCSFQCLSHMKLYLTVAGLRCQSLSAQCTQLWDTSATQTHFVFHEIAALYVSFAVTHLYQYSVHGVFAQLVFRTTAVGRRKFLFRRSVYTAWVEAQKCDPVRLRRRTRKKVMSAPGGRKPIDRDMITLRSIALC